MLDIVMCLVRWWTTYMEREGIDLLIEVPGA